MKFAMLPPKRRITAKNYIYLSPSSCVVNQDLACDSPLVSRDMLDLIGAGNPTHICKVCSLCSTSFSKQTSSEHNRIHCSPRAATHFKSTDKSLKSSPVHSGNCSPCVESGKVICTLPYYLCNSNCDLAPSPNTALQTSFVRKACSCEQLLTKERFCVKETIKVSSTNECSSMGNPKSLRNLNTSLCCDGCSACKALQSHQNRKDLICRGCPISSLKSQNLPNIAGAFCQHSKHEVHSTLDANSSNSRKNVTSSSRLSGISDALQRLRFHWKSLLLFALLLPSVMSRENLHLDPTEKAVTNYSVDGSVFSDVTSNATELPRQDKSLTPSQNTVSLKPGCTEDKCSNSKPPAALKGEKKQSSQGERSVHMERIKMMLIPIVTVASAAIILVSVYCICRYKKCLCCQRQLDKCNSICDQCMRGDFGGTSATGVVINDDGEMEALGDGAVTPTPSSGESAHIRLAVPARHGQIVRGTGKSHSAMYIFRQPSHSGSRGRLSKSLQHVESTSSQQRRISRGSRGSLQSASTAAALSVPPASRSESIHRLLGGPPRTSGAASRSTSFSDSASKNQAGQQSSSSNKGQNSVGNSRQSSVRSLAPSAHGDSQDVPKGFLPPMRPF